MDFREIKGQGIRAAWYQKEMNLVSNDRGERVAKRSKKGARRGHRQRKEIIRNVSLPPSYPGGAMQKVLGEEL